MLEEVAVGEESLSDRPRGMDVLEFVEIERAVADEPDAREQQRGDDAKRRPNDRPRRNGRHCA